MKTLAYKILEEHLLEGNLERAEDYLTRAQAAGSEDAPHNRNELRLKREDRARMERLMNR